MHVIVNITSSHINNIAVFVVCGRMWSGQWPGPEQARSEPGARGLRPGRAWASNTIIVLQAGPGLDILFGKATHKMLALVSPYSGNPNIRYDSSFNFGSFV